MQFSVFVLLLFIFYNYSVSCENKTNEEQNVAKEYIRGFKISNSKVLGIPGILITPFIVLPSSTIERISTNANRDDVQEADKDKHDIEVIFRQALDRGSGNNNNLRQIKGNDTQNETMNNTMSDEKTTKGVESTTPGNVIPEQNNTQETSTQFDKTTKPYVLYPNALYNNRDVNTLSITVKGPDEILIPPLDNENWKNFTLGTNLTQANKATPSNSSSTTENPSVNETDSPTKGRYPAALYNRPDIDQLSITTNSYTNGSPLLPPRDDRWTSISTMKKTLPTSNEFRPLAGLYYDGFLHRPVYKTPGFVPQTFYNVF